MDQITQDIANTYNSLISTSPTYKSLMAKVEAGKATSLEADQFAMVQANALNKAMGLHLTDAISAADYKRIAAEVLPKGLGTIHEKVAAYALQFQKWVNKKMGVALKAVEASYNADAVKAIVSAAVKGETYSAVSGVVQNEVRHFAQNVVTDTVRVNAKAAEEAGLEPVVTRRYDGVGLHDGKDICKWCLERCGENMTYSEAIAKDAFRRHPGCGCEIVYSVRNKTQRQSYWEHNEWSDYNG